MSDRNSWQALLTQKNAIVLPQIDQPQLLQSISRFLQSEPEWLDRAIASDPALQRHPDGSAVAKHEAYSQLFTYQGLHARALHREAHELYNAGKIVEARALSQAARSVTGGIEIHPGARIGKGFFVDHGAGVVIGETAEIGDDAFLYHSVTLGATGSPKDIDTSDPANPNRRHPKLGNRVRIGNGAQLLGAVTVDDDVVIGTGARIIGKVHIGKGARIGAGVEVKADVPEGAVVVGMVPEIPGVIDKAQGAYTPITRGEVPDTKITAPEWLGYLARGYERLRDGVEGNNSRIH